ncbi:MAG: hypothetical protein WCA08_12540 [Desulfoferrobacter sp.]
MSPAVFNSPSRITDLIELNKKGAAVTCSTSFEVIPVDFKHRSIEFQALVFICRFSGTVDGQPYTFRKCYARGCVHDLCPRVSQAVMIANRYLLRDYHRLQRGGIQVEQKLFTLAESVVQMMDLKADPKQTMIIDDYIRMAKEGSRISVAVDLEYVPATEHFEYHKNQQTFMLADFTVTGEKLSAACQRCLGCYPTDKEEEEKGAQIKVANDRLSQLYREFELSSVYCEKRFFIAA